MVVHYLLFAICSDIDQRSNRSVVAAMALRKDSLLSVRLAIAQASPFGGILTHLYDKHLPQSVFQSGSDALPSLGDCSLAILKCALFVKKARVCVSIVLDCCYVFLLYA